MSESETSPWSSTEALDFLHRLDQDSRDLQHWVTTLLEHPWFTSLWTLQEMALRPDAFILLDDGVPQYGDTVLDIMMLRGVVYDIGDTLDSPSTATTIRDAVQRASHTQQAEPLCVFNETNFADRLKSIELLYGRKGLLDCPMGISFPNPVYGAALRREVSRTIDRILGIMQVYKISCNPEPPGHNEMAQLHHLEDEFGQKLVAMDPVLSQLFIHVASSPPRRSWLITQGCSAKDKFWNDIADRAEGNDFFEVIETVTAVDESGVNLRFKGQASSLLDFVHALSPTSTMPYSQRDNLFSAPINRAQPGGYHGLVLDHHISRTILGEEIHFFPSSEAMYAAARTIDDKYRLHVQGDDRLYFDESSGATRHAITVTVAPLAFQTFDRKREGGTYKAVGLVLAPVQPLGPRVTEQGEFCRSPSLSTLTWTRLGLIRWSGSMLNFAKLMGATTVYLKPTTLKL